MTDTTTPTPANAPVVRETIAPTLTDVEFYATAPMVDQLWKVRMALAPQFADQISDDLAFRVLAYLQSIVVRHEQSLPPLELGQTREQSDALIILSQPRIQRLASIVDTDEGSLVESIEIEFRGGHETQLTMEYTKRDSHNTGSVRYRDSNVAHVDDRVLNCDLITCPDPERSFRDAFEKDRLKALVLHAQNRLRANGIDAVVTSVDDRRNPGLPVATIQVDERSLAITVASRHDNDDVEFAIGVPVGDKYVEHGVKDTAFDYERPSNSDKILKEHGYLTALRVPFGPRIVNADLAVDAVASVANRLAALQRGGLERD